MTQDQLKALLASLRALRQHHQFTRDNIGAPGSSVRSKAAEYVRTVDRAIICARGYEDPFAAPWWLDLVRACEEARDQFAFYAREHTSAGKMDKAATNQRFTAMLSFSLHCAAGKTAVIRAERERRCDEIADKAVPEYRDGKRAFDCSSWTAKRWQAAWDGACLALGGDPKESVA